MDRQLHSNTFAVVWCHTQVDAIINTIGFPLVGGPAGSVEAGRQTDISKSILKTKNVPYMVASPLLVQNLESWMRDGITGVQQSASSCSFSYMGWKVG